MASDLFDFNVEPYIVMADMYSKMCFVWKMSSAGVTSAAIFSMLKEIFAENAVPDILKSGNGLQYSSAAFTEFTEEWDFNTHYIHSSLSSFKWICRIKDEDHQDSFHKS